MIQTVNSGEPLYPQKLLKLSTEAPKRIFYFGNIETLSRPCVGIIGSRTMTGYADSLINTYIRDLFSYDVTVISGFVRGVDLAVHRVGLLNSVGSVAVLGCGIQHLKDSSPSAKIFKENIEYGGLFISEYDGSFQGRQWSFVRRNRLIAALSDVLVVIEASESSGSLITARWAHKLGKPIYMFSYPLDSLNAKGLAYIGTHLSANVMFDLTPILINLKLKPKNPINNTFDVNLASAILHTLKRMPCSFDELFGQHTFDAGTLNVELMNLMIQGKIYLSKAKYYAK